MLNFIFWEKKQIQITDEFENHILEILQVHYRRTNTQWREALKQFLIDSEVWNYVSADRVNPLFIGFKQWTVKYSPILMKRTPPEDKWIMMENFLNSYALMKWINLANDRCALNEVIVTAKHIYFGYDNDYLTENLHIIEEHQNSFLDNMNQRIVDYMKYR